jgi:hypothetical protein
MLLTDVRILIGLLGVGSSALLACSSSSDSPPPAAASTADASLVEGDDDAALDAGPPAACVLPRASKTGSKKCDDCLQKSCCGVLRECFDDEDCSNLADCYYRCTTKYPAKSDAGAQCVHTCVQEHTRSSQTYQSALECQAAECRTPCTP